MAQVPITGSFTGFAEIELPSGSNRTIVNIESGDSIADVVGSSDENTDFIIDPGTYTETDEIRLQDGHRLIGNGDVLINSTAEYVIELDGVKNIAISGIVLNGGNQSKRGIYSINSENIFIKNVYVSDMTFAGMFFFKSKGILVDQCKITDSSELNTGGNFATGNISIAGVEDAIFRNISISDFAENYGYGIKCHDFAGETKCRNIAFDNLDISIEGVSLWSTENQVPSFAMEFFNIDAQNIEIKNSYFKNMVSFSYSDYSGRGIVFRNNVVNPIFGEAIELRAKGLKIIDNEIHSNRANPLVNYGNHRTQDIEIRGNKIHCGYDSFNEGIITLKDEMENLVISSNDVFIHQSWGMPLLYLGGDDGSTHKNISINGNRITRTESLNSGEDQMVLLENGNDYEDFSVRNNVGQDFPVNRCEYEDGNELNIEKQANRDF